ncbi:MAG: PAS domain-containing protein [Alphaproteobacteria bacterium]|nr:PAS domain-containing protein [Alphaproteobacteria bacterium]
MDDSERPSRAWSTTLAVAILGVVLLATLWAAGALSATGAAVVAVGGAAAFHALRRGWFAEHARREQRRIEAERAAEQRLRMATSDAAAAAAAIDALPDAILDIGGDLRVIAANAAARERFGARPGAEIAAVVRDPDVLAGIDDAFAGRETVAVAFTLAGPIERHYEARLLRPSTGAGGRPRVLAVFHEVTALRRVDALRVDFVANVSHELRTPLAAVLGFIETLRGPARDDAPARERFLGIMQAEAQRMTRLVSDLLSLSRIEASEHAAPTDKVALPPIVGRVVDALALPAREKRIRIAVDVPATLPAVLGDGDQLQQVVQNLVDNAIKYGRADGEIRIAARASADGGRVALGVADEGEGIAREHLARLTERFYRVDAGRSRRLGGTGLGLAIVKHIVNRHRGTLEIESEPGKGSRFTVTLPTA